MKKPMLIVLGLAAGSLISWQAALAEGDAARGESAYGKCGGCHSLEAGVNGGGPSLAGIVDRTAGTEAGFDYSPAMKDSGIEWSPGNLDKFLADGQGFMPGHTMQFPDVADAQEREDLIEFMKQN